MIDQVVISEKKLLRNIQWRFVIWLMIAFVIFELTLVAGTFVVLKDQLVTQAQNMIKLDWSQKRTDAIEAIEAANKEANWKMSAEQNHELISSMVVDANGSILNENISPVEVDVSMKDITKYSVIGQKQELNGYFEIKEIHHVSTLLGVLPLWNNGQYLGYMLSIRSLAMVNKTLNELYLIDLDIGLVSIIVIFLLTHVLSGRALVPIRQALQRQRNFVNDAGHELRTPLAILRGTLELAEEEEDLGVVREALKDSLTEVDYLSRLIANLSTLARMESGTLDIDRKTVDLREIAEEVIAALMLLGQKLGVQLFVESQETAVLLGDPVRLRQLLLILVENAIKYNVQGGRVDVFIEQQRQGWMLTIQDTGIGIPEEDLPHIFNRFFRSVKTAQHDDGSGIGLSIAAWIIDQHRGKVTVHSKFGQGTVFQVWLPLRG